MSVFDEICHESPCPRCGTMQKLATQIKHENAWQRHFSIGDFIDAELGSVVLEGAIYVKCSECNSNLTYDAKIVDGCVVGMIGSIGWR